MDHIDYVVAVKFCKSEVKQCNTCGRNVWVYPDKPVDLAQHRHVIESYDNYVSDSSVRLKEDEQESAPRKRRRSWKPEESVQRYASNSEKEIHQINQRRSCKTKVLAQHHARRYKGDTHLHPRNQRINRKNANSSTAYFKNPRTEQVCVSKI